MSDQVRVGIYGAAGRMGQRLIACAEEHPQLSVEAAIDRGVTRGAINQCDVLIDFSLPEATEHLLSSISGLSVGLVTGVTGRSEAQEEKVLAETKNRALFSAANFSLGIAVLNRLVADATRLLGPDFDAELFEIHHRLKADAPSGTALQLAQTAAHARDLQWPDARRNRDGHTGARGNDEIGTAAIRGGTVAGEHTLYLLGPAERIELTHRATNRDVFVHGALKAALWLKGQPKGLYNMQNLLGI